MLEYVKYHTFIHSRNLFGTSAYLTFTVDKIISTIARHLQNMATEEVCNVSFNVWMLDIVFGVVTDCISRIVFLV